MSNFFTTPADLMAGTTARAVDINDRLSAVEAAFDNVELATTRALKLPAGTTTDQLIAETAANRAFRTIGFDTSGDVTLYSPYNWKADWGSGVEYFLHDTVRDSATKNLYFCIEGHTSGIFANDSSKWSLAINVEDVETAKTAAEDARDLAKDWANKELTTVDGTSYSAKHWATHPDVVTVSTDIADVRIVAADITNVNLVGADIANVNLVSVDIGDVRTVATDIVPVAAVGVDIANVNIVATDIVSVGTVATDIVSVGTVAADIIPVAAVGNDITNVVTVSQNLTNIDTVANNITDVGTVATDILKVIKVADDLSEAISEVETVANDLNETSSEIELVGNSIDNVNIVGQSIDNLNAVATDMDNVNAVAGSIDGVDSCATNMAVIIDSPDHADDAQKYADHAVNTQFTDSDGNTSYSAKHYATLASSSGQAYVTIEGDTRTTGDSSGLLAGSSQSGLSMQGKGGANIRTEQGSDTIFFDSRAVAMALALG